MYRVLYNRGSHYKMPNHIHTCFSRDVVGCNFGCFLSLLYKLIFRICLLMKVLENRTKASCQEMQMLETLEDLRELRHRQAGVDTEKMLQQNKDEGERLLKLQEEEDEAFVQ